MPPPDEIEADEYARLLAAEEQERSDGDARQRHKTYEERVMMPDLVAVSPTDRPMMEDHFHVYKEELLELTDLYRKAVAKADARGRPRRCASLPASQGAADRPELLRIQSAALAILWANAKAYEAMPSRHEGQVIPTPQPSAGQGPTLSEAYAAWKGEGRTRGTNKPSERNSWKPTRPYGG